MWKGIRREPRKTDEDGDSAAFNQTNKNEKKGKRETGGLKAKRATRQKKKILILVEDRRGEEDRRQRRSLGEKNKCNRFLILTHAWRGTSSVGFGGDRANLHSPRQTLERPRARSPIACGRGACLSYGGARRSLGNLPFTL